MAAGSWGNRIARATVLHENVGSIKPKDRGCPEREVDREDVWKIFYFCLPCTHSQPLGRDAGRLHYASLHFLYEAEESLWQI